MEKPIREDFIERDESPSGEMVGYLDEDSYIEALETYISYLENLKNLPNELKGVSNNEQKEKPICPKAQQCAHTPGGMICPKDVCCPI